MKANVIVTPNFQREAKRLLKKYRSLKLELALEGLIAEIQSEVKEEEQSSEEEKKEKEE